MKQQAINSTVRIWDLPTRCFHWALALCVSAALLSAWVGDDWMVWHMRCGLATLALLVFRLIWGLIGGRWSRFASFLFAPTALWRYVRRRARPGERFGTGHSPLGALAVLAMLLVLLAQVGTGLFADDEIAYNGPLLSLVSEHVSKLCTHWHRHGGQWLIYALLTLHFCAIVFYQWRGKGLLAAMWHGNKDLPPETPASRDGWAARLLALVLFAVCAAVAVWLSRMG